jgi:hypothetical protein
VAVLDLDRLDGGGAREVRGGTKTLTITNADATTRGGWQNRKALSAS